MIRKNYIDLLFKPSRFFDAVEKEDSKFLLIMQYVIMSLVSLAVFFLAVVVPMAAESEEINTKSLVVLTVVGVLFTLFNAFLGPFISAAITHLGVKFVEGKKGFLNTFKPSLYSSLAFLFMLTIEMPIYMLFLKLLNPGELGALVYDLIVTLIELGLAIWCTVIQVIGLKKFQALSTLRAVAAVLIAGCIGFAIALIIVLVVGISVFVALKNLFVAGL